MYASYLSHLDVVKLSLETGASVVAVNTNKLDKDTAPGMTALNFAAAKGSKEVAKLLLAHKADVNNKDQYGLAPLFNAVGDLGRTGRRL